MVIKRDQHVAGVPDGSDDYSAMFADACGQFRIRPDMVLRNPAGSATAVDLNRISEILRVAGTIIWTKLRQEYLNSEVRECSSSPDESCGGGHGVLPFGTSSL